MFIRELLAAFAHAQIRYCVVGGVAMNLHGVPRMTYDVDLLVERMRDERNLIAVTFTDPANPLREVDILVAPPIDVDNLKRIRSGAGRHG